MYWFFFFLLQVRVAGVSFSDKAAIEFFFHTNNSSLKEDILDTRWGVTALIICWEFASRLTCPVIWSGEQSCRSYGDQSLCSLWVDISLQMNGGWLAVLAYYYFFFIIIIIIMYLYSAQYLHILQDSKRYLNNPTVQVQPQLTSNWHSPNWKIEAQGWPFINILEVL